MATNTFIANEFGEVTFVTDVASGTVTFVAGDPVVGLAPVSSAQTLSAGLVSDADAFYTTTIAGASILTLLPGLFDDADVVYAPLIGNTSQFLVSAGVVASDDVIYAPSVANVSRLLPSSIGSDDSFFDASIAVGAPSVQTLLPTLHADADDFRVPLIGAPPGVIAPSRVTDVDSYFIHGVDSSKSLLVLLWNDTDVFYVHDIGRVQAKKGRQNLDVDARVDDADQIFPATFKTGTLSPQLYTDPEPVYALTSTTGPVGVQAQFVTNDDVFFRPLINRVLLPTTRVLDADIIPTPLVVGRYTLSVGTVVLAPDVIYVPLFKHIVQPPRVIDVDVVPRADVGWKVFALRTDDNDVVYVPIAKAIAYIHPVLYGDEDSIDTYAFFVQSVSGGIPMPKPPNILGGEVGRKVLTGAVGKQRLVGSLGENVGVQGKVLTGTIRGKNKAA